jgi:general secretion pathway protein L
MAVTDAFRLLRIPVSRARLPLGDLVQRWQDALLSCLPDGARRLLTRGDQQLIIVPEGSTARVYESQGTEVAGVGELDPRDPTLLQAALAGAKGRRRRMVLRLAERQVLKRRVTFPAQVRDNLAQVIGYEMDRLSPFQSDKVYYDFRVLEDLARGGKLRVELALCLREQVQDWLQLVRDAGAQVEQLTWNGAWPKANLLPAKERPQRGTGPFGATKLLLLLVLVLMAAVLAAPIWQKQEIRDERLAQIAELKASAEKVLELRTALEKARAGSVAVLQRKWEQPRMIDLLLELTERLPDDTWVQTMDYRDGEIQIRGESTQATSLINLLDQAPGITEVSFRSPVVQVAGSGLERFHVSLKYKRPDES